ERGATAAYLSFRVISMKPLRPLLFPLLLCIRLFSIEVCGQERTTPPAAFDVIHYDAQIEPDITNKTITGKVLIRLITRTDNLAAIEFDCGELTIDAVHEKGRAQKFVRQESHLRILLSRPTTMGETREFEIEYHGAPRRGIRFFPDQQQVYTVFNTSQWMICIDAPADRATLRLRLILPAGLEVVANGRLVSQQNL